MSVQQNDVPWYYRRAGGRRHYNAVRQFRAAFRRREVVKLLAEGLNQADIARRLGVHRSTICRDVRVIEKAWREQQRCPLCGARRFPGHR